MVSFIGQTVRNVVFFPKRKSIFNSLINQIKKMWKDISLQQFIIFFIRKNYVCKFNAVCSGILYGQIGQESHFISEQSDIVLSFSYLRIVYKKFLLLGPIQITN